MSSEKTHNGVPISEIIKLPQYDPSIHERISHRKVKGPHLEIQESDPAWAVHFQTFKDRILEAFQRAHDEAKDTDLKKCEIVAIHHIGSSSVPGLPAKPVIDIDLVLSSSSLAYEPFYIPCLERAGFQFLQRAPKRHQHRFLAAHEPMSCNLHVFEPYAADVERDVIFRDWLRGCEEDREFYARVKRESAVVSREKGEDVLGYNGRKQGCIREIMERAFVSEGLLIK